MKMDIEQFWIKWIYGVTAFIAFFTGFGNMPLYGRYYLSDLPGLHWTGNFIVNVKVHYLFGAVLLAQGIYFLSLYLLVRRHGMGFTRMGMAQALALGLVLISGVIMAVKNLPGVVFTLPLLVTMNLFHMGSAMLFASVTLITLSLNKQWFQQISVKR